MVHQLCTRCVAQSLVKYCSPINLYNEIQVQTFPELRGIIDCSRSDFSNEEGLILGCKPVLGPTMLSEGSAADIRVEPLTME